MEGREYADGVMLRCDDDDAVKKERMVTVKEENLRWLVVVVVEGRRRSKYQRRYEINKNPPKGERKHKMRARRTGKECESERVRPH